MPTCPNNFEWNNNDKGHKVPPNENASYTIVHLYNVNHNSLGAMHTKCGSNKMLSRDVKNKTFCDTFYITIYYDCVDFNAKVCNSFIARLLRFSRGIL